MLEPVLTREIERESLCKALPPGPADPAPLNQCPCCFNVHASRTLKCEVYSCPIWNCFYKITVLEELKLFRLLFSHRAGQEMSAELWWGTKMLFCWLHNLAEVSRLNNISSLLFPTFLSILQRVLNSCNMWFKTWLAGISASSVLLVLAQQKRTSFLVKTDFPYNAHDHNSLCRCQTNLLMNELNGLQLNK